MVATVWENNAAESYCVRAAVNWSHSRALCGLLVLSSISEITPVTPNQQLSRARRFSRCEKNLAKVSTHLVPPAPARPPACPPPATIVSSLARWRSGTF